MEKRYYDADALDRATRELEQEYGMTTVEFYARYCAGEQMEIPHFHQHTWASFHEDILRLTKGAGAWVEAAKQDGRVKP
jgi:hypothetical protein